MEVFSMLSIFSCILQKPGENGKTTTQIGIECSVFSFDFVSVVCVRIACIVMIYLDAVYGETIFSEAMEMGENLTCWDNIQIKWKMSCRDFISTNYGYKFSWDDILANVLGDKCFLVSNYGIETK